MTLGPAARNHAGVQPNDAPDGIVARLTAAGTSAIAAAVVGSAVLAVSAVAFVALLVQPHDNVLIGSPRVAFDHGGIVVADASGSDLREGDVVIRIDDMSVEDIAGHPFRRHVTPHIGSTSTYEIVRDGERMSVDVPIERRSTGSIVGSTWSGAVLVPVLALMGAFLLWRRPDLAAARTLFVVGALAVLAWVLSTHGPSPMDLAAGRWWFLLGGASLVACEVGLLHFVLVLTEDERAPRRGRLPVLVAVTAVALALDVVTARAGADSSVERMRATWFPRLEPVIVVAILLVAVVRYRRASSDVTKRQLRLIAWQLSVSGVLFVAFFALPDALGGEPLLPSGLSAVSFWSFPAVLAVAVLQFDLFEIRHLVHRWALYLSLASILTGLYAGVLAGLAFVTGDRPGLASSAVAAAVVAVAFHPVRARLQRGLDRVVFGTAAEPSEVLAELGRRLEDGGQPGALLDTVVDTVAQSLGREYVAIVVGDGDDREVVAAHGAPMRECVEVPLLHQGAEVGRLVVALHRNAVEIGSSEQRLLAGLAAHVGTAVAAARLTVDLRRSRERLVAALEDERRRLGRDLHDGLGPRLAAASMKLEASGRMARRDLDAAMLLHDEVRAELGDVISEVRRIVYALRPAALDQLGLVGALREQANRLMGRANGSGPTQFTVDVRGPLPELPAAVEVAAFRIASEAMTNAVRHASATHCAVVLAADGSLEVTIVDDGRGVPDPLPAGVGVASMRERADELGGTMSVRRAVGGGTIVTATLPLGDA